MSPGCGLYAVPVCGACRRSSRTAAIVSAAARAAGGAGVQQAGAHDLEDWADRILDAASLDDVFAASRDPRD